MKKTSIYILSLIVIIVVAGSVLIPAWKMLSVAVEGFSAGFTAGINGDAIESGTPLAINFTPEINTMINPQDSIKFENGNKLPIVIDKVAVMVPDSKVPAWLPWFTGFCYPIQVILLLALIWRFMKFIINISKEKIFVKENVALLRQFSFLLLAIAAMEILAGVTNDILISDFSFSMEGYGLSASWTFPWSNILLGCIGLLMAQVWARGIEIKEEQELTI